VSHEVATKSQYRSSDRKRSSRIILKLILRCEYRLILTFIQQKHAKGMKASDLIYDRI
jgi:predicted patatin/cPLA2 family phospholipase